MKFRKNVHWMWLGILIVINVIPIGNSSGSLSRNRLFVFRLDYVVHSLMIMVFAWLWLWSRLRGFQFFVRHERLKYIAMVMVAGICLEYLQLLVPWRSFNPVDMYYNLVGALLTVVIVMIGEKV